MSLARRLNSTVVIFLVKVPSLNDVPLHYLKPNSLVKFRCLIQDMFDPEFYMGTYETVDPSTKAKVSAPLGFCFRKRVSKTGSSTLNAGLPKSEMGRCSVCAALCIAPALFCVCCLPFFFSSMKLCLSSSLTVWLFPGEEMWEVQRRDGMWGKSRSL